MLCTTATNTSNTVLEVLVAVVQSNTIRTQTGAAER